MAVDEVAEEGDGHLGAHVLAPVHAAVEHDLRLVLVRADVIADLGRPQLAALVAAPDAEDPGDLGLPRRDRLDRRISS
ncbi:MAG TPA: hypothetical protein VMP86_09030 [Candidatus Binatia bacterium]|nr:hypothetical protein [Candidatus Binatia bacterium]